MNFLSQHLQTIKTLCEAYKNNSLFAFGSVVSDNFTSESDVDLLVDFEKQNPLEYSDHYFQLKFALQEILKREIDLLEKKSLSNSYLEKNIERTKVLLYGRGN